VDCLERADVAWCAIGGVAVNHWASEPMRGGPVRVGHQARALVACALTLLVTACGGSDGAPVAPSPPTPAPSFAVTGTVTDALSGAALTGADVIVEGVGATTSAADGSFSLTTNGPQALRRVTLRSPSAVERITGVKVGAALATFSLIPTSFDLVTFDQMARGSGGELHRWMAPPRLVVQRRVLAFTNLSDLSYIGTARLLSDEEVAGLIADLSDGVSMVSGGLHTAFADVTIEAAGEGEVVGVSHPGAIHVARYEGLRAATTFAGYSRWSWNGLGELAQAIVMLDRVYEESGTPFRRALRTHELGHAYGYSHVTARPSFMSASGTEEVTANDRDIARIAFQRPPRNVSPDSDPSTFSTNRASTRETWTGSN
jgi:hypothetical protein